MIYFIVFELGVVVSLYSFIAGMVYGHMAQDILAMEERRQRLLAVVLCIVFWPLGTLIGLFLRCHSKFEPTSWQDWALIPWWYLRYAFAWGWTEGWRLWLKVRYWRLRGTKRYRWMTNPGYGRHTDPHPVMCPCCLWAGPIRWLHHTYAFVYPDDVEPVDQCPRCFYDV